MRKRWLALAFLILGFLCLLAGMLYSFPSLRERVDWRLSNAWVRLQRWLNPPERLVFVPAGQRTPASAQTVTGATLVALVPAGAATLTILPRPSLQATSAARPTPQPTGTPQPTWTSIPGMVALSGIIHEYQQFNNCGPANLSMALSFWGWQGSQNDTRAYLRPRREVDDKNVNPSEMVEYVEQFTGLRALARLNGSLDLLKRLLAAGFPVILEKGHDPADDFWMGHYVVVSGYDDSLGQLLTQDSLIAPDLPFPYVELEERWWRDFNYVYVLVYPAGREAEVRGLLGADADEASNFQAAARRALDEIPALSGCDLFFAWFNLGASQTSLQEYSDAASAFDQAFALYAALEEAERPYRLMWYRIEPYPAYYYTARYQDVINLANTTLAWVGKPVLEETYYWRGLAYEATGLLNQAIADLKKAAALNPYYAAPRQALQHLGIESP